MWGEARPLRSSFISIYEALLSFLQVQFRFVEYVRLVGCLGNSRVPEYSLGGLEFTSS